MSLVAGSRLGQAREATPRGEYAYASIRTRVLMGEFGKGVPLREAELVRQLGISRTPIREALRRLQAEGLVRPIHHGGYVVVEWDLQDLQQVYAVRIALEKLSVREAAANRTRVDIAQLHDALDAIREATESSLVRLPALNLRFHLMIADSSSNTYLRSMLGNIAEIFDRYPAAEMTLAGRKDAGLAEHVELLAVIERGDADTAERLMHEHLERGMGALLDARSEPPPAP